MCGASEGWPRRSGGRSEESIPTWPPGWLAGPMSQFRRRSPSLIQSRSGRLCAGSWAESTPTASIGAGAGGARRFGPHYPPWPRSARRRQPGSPRRPRRPFSAWWPNLIQTDPDSGSARGSGSSWSPPGPRAGRVAIDWSNTWRGSGTRPTWSGKSSSGTVGYLEGIGRIAWRCAEGPGPRSAVGAACIDSEEHFAHGSGGL